MKEVLYFYSPGCPFCKKADKFIAQAIEENPDFAKVEIKRIDEVAQKEYAASFDYYYSAWCKRYHFRKGRTAFYT